MMSDETSLTVAPERQPPATVRTAPIIQRRDFLMQRVGEIRSALPAHISPERFVRVVMTAMQLNPELVMCDQQSLWNACMRACNDGLLPDGREAALVPFKSKVTYIPMYAGLLKQFRNSGEFKWVAAGLVCEGDVYEHWITETGEHFKHVPGDDQDLTKVRRVYALATTMSGGSFIADLPLSEIRKHQTFSRASREDAPWKLHWEAMAKKTAIRQLAKLLPMSSDLDALMRRDEEALLIDREEAREDAASEEQIEAPPPTTGNAGLKAKLRPQASARTAAADKPTSASATDASEDLLDPTGSGQPAPAGPSSDGGPPTGMELEQRPEREPGEEG